MKRISFVLCIITLCGCALFASNSKPKEDVEMASYEQSWLDSRGTIALKNNTKETIKNVTFVLEYLDMNNTQLDYETYSLTVDIEPNMSRKYDVPAYESRRNYHYYKTPGNNYSDHPSFKVRYRLKSYNDEVGSSTNDAVAVTEDYYERVYDTDSPSAGSLLSSLIIFGFPFIGFYVAMLVLAVKMAKRRNRSRIGWFLLSLIITPFLGCIILAIIGKKEKLYTDD